MKILYMLGSLDFGGAEVMTLEIAKRVQERGHDVTILTYQGVDKNLLRSSYNNLKFITLSSRFYSIILIVRLVTLLKKENFDIIHTHLFPSLYLGALLHFLLGDRSKWIFTEHSTSNSRRSLPLLRVVEQIIYASYDKITTISDAASVSLDSWLKKNASSTVIYNGIAVDKFLSAIPLERSKSNLSQDDNVILMVGRCRKEKNHQILLHALTHLSSKYKLVFAGDGPELNYLKSLAMELCIADRVIFLGNVASVERLYKLADVYVLPSHFEGFGLSAIEAAAASLPIIYSDVSGLSEVMRGFGLSVEPDDSVRIAQLISDVCNNKQLRKELVFKSNILAKKYDIEQSVDAYIKLYSQSCISTV